jgi:hypothetical protein
VFLPGNSFLARIAYGFPGGREAGFLAYWLVRSFLGTCYRLENPISSNVYPKFGITDWGRQVVASANKVITDDGLSRSLIGRPVETVARAAGTRGSTCACLWRSMRCRLAPIYSQVIRNNYS